MYELHNFDPLSFITVREGEVKKSVKRGIRNIVKSYTGYYDIFSELIQNSLDALEGKWRDNKRNYTPKLDININIAENTIIISDNGIGMSEETFQYFLAPHTSFKDGHDWTRGNKGVGATFLAYAFNNLSIHSKEAGEGIVELINGRKWADSDSNEERPAFVQLANPLNDFLENEDTGTVMKIKIDSGIKPDLNYNQAKNAIQWDAILRIKSPLGGIYISGETEFDKFRKKLKVTVNVTSNDDETSIFEVNKPEYVFPHEINELKIEDIEDVLKERERASIDGRNDFLPQYTNLHGYYGIWTKDDLLPHEGSDIDEISNKLNIASSLSDIKKDLIKKYNVSVYGILMHSTRIWDEYSDNQVSLRKGVRILQGGLQIACDRMTQGEMIEIPLTSNIGLQRQTHVVVHFEQGNPDLGRKTFQPEMTELAKNLATNVVKKFLTYRLDHFKADDSRSRIVSRANLQNYVQQQRDNLLENPLDSSLSCIKQISKPEKENDVIALFNQLIGGNIIKGMEIYATEPHKQYDSLVKVTYSEELKYSQNNRLGVPITTEVIGSTMDLILEYKYDFISLIKDFGTETKNPSDIDICVAWNTSSLQFQGEYELRSLLIEDRHLTRQTHGATHLVYITGNKAFEVIFLEDLIHFMKFRNNIERINDFQSKYNLN